MKAGSAEPLRASTAPRAAAAERAWPDADGQTLPRLDQSPSLGAAKL